MNERTRNILVGFTALVGLVGAAAMLTLFGYVPAFLEDAYPVSVLLPDASGISLGSRVTYRGIDVGKVSDIQIDALPKLATPAAATSIDVPSPLPAAPSTATPPNPTHNANDDKFPNNRATIQTNVGVRITLMLRRDARVPRAVRALMLAPLLAGSSAIKLDIAPSVQAWEKAWIRVAQIKEQLNPSKPGAPAPDAPPAPSKAELERMLAQAMAEIREIEDLLNQPLPTDGSAVISGRSTSVTAELSDKLDGALAAFSEKFDKAGGSFAKLGQLGDAAGDLKELAAAWAKVGRNVDQLTEPRAPGAVDDPNAKTMANLSTVLARADHRLRELEATVKHVNSLLGDAELRGDLKATMANAKTFTQKINATADQADAAILDAKGLVGDTRGEIKRLGERYVALADDLSKTVQEMRKALEGVNAKKGTMGKMVYDASLYDNFNDMTVRLREMVDEARMLMQKFQKEGLPLK